MKKKLYFVLAFVLALVAAGSIYFYVSHLEAEAKKDRDLATVPVAAAEVPARTQMTPDMVTTEEIPASQIHADAARDEEEIVGSITTVALFPGEQVLDQKLVAPQDTGEGLAYTISPGKRAMAVSVDEVVAVGNMVLPGDHVDVVALLDEDDDEDGTQEELSTLFIQNIKVLAVGQQMSTGGTSIEGNTATLELTPEQVQQLALADHTGRIILTLRGAADDGEVYLRPSVKEDLLN